MENQLANVNWRKSFENKTVNESWLVFKEIVHNSVRQFVPEKEERRKKNEERRKANGYRRNVSRR